MRSTTVSQWLEASKAAEASLHRIVSDDFVLLLTFPAASESHAAATRPLRIAYLLTSLLRLADRVSPLELALS